MGDNKSGLFEQLGTWADVFGIFLSNYALLFIIILSIVLAFVIFIRNRTKKTPEIVGNVLKVVAAGVSLITALTLLMPFIARAFWGTANSPQPIIATCLSKIAPACNESLSQYLTVLSRTTIPVSTLLGVAVLSLFFASVVWLYAAIRDAW